jgi:Tol biopolymer transport system component/C-terminal processing protease CtpA/Prc
MSRWHVRLGFALVSFAVAAGSATAQNGSTTAVPTFAEPGIAPDHSEIAFVSGGDIWTVPSAGGVARLLVSHPANESRPLYSPDGKRLAFISTRTGNGDIYVLTFATGNLERLTFDDGLDQLDSWSPDGKWLYFSSTSREIAGMNDVFRVSSDGGTPMPVSADRYTNEYWAAPAPNGGAMAFTARGTTSGQWWRLGRSHLDESEIWILRDPQAMRYERVSGGKSKDEWPMWMPDGRTLYYVSDKTGPQNIVKRAIGGDATQVTRFTNGRVLWPTISADGRMIAFERDFGIWTLDTNTGEATQVQISLRGAPAGPSVERLTLTNGLEEMALSPDGKKVAFIVHGEVFAASSKDGGNAVRVTSTTGRERQIEWAPDSRKLIYVSDRDGTQALYLYDFGTSQETRLTQSPGGDVSPVFSPDGKSVAFQRGGRELRILDLDTKRDRLLARGQMDRVPFTADGVVAWSPDGRWIAYVDQAEKGFSNVYVIPSAGGDKRQVTFLANEFGGKVAWSTDGTYLIYDSGQRTEDRQLARIDLVLRTPRFREDQFRDLFRVETRNPAQPNPAPQPNPTPTQSPQQRPPQPLQDSSARPAASDSAVARPNAAGRRAPVQIVFDDIRRRLSMLDVGVSVNTHSISPDGKWLLLTAAAGGQQNLYVYPLDELARDQAVARQITSTPGGKRDAQWSPDGKEVYYLEQGRIASVNVDSRQTRPLPVTAEMDVNFDDEKMEVFSQAWRYLADNYADSAMNGVDWAAVRTRYAPHIAGARTPDEMRRMLNLMVGELNSSHSGVGGPPGGPGPSTGRIGLRFDRAAYEANGALHITGVVPLGASAVAGVKAGQYLLAVDGRKIDAHTNLDELLANTIGRKVTLSIAQTADGRDAHDVAVRPLNAPTEKALLYREWVEDKRAYVAKVSNGRLGYVHMFDMGAGSLAQLYVDLDAENHAREGVIVDVRHNNGGFVNAYAIDVFARRPYMTMTPRGGTQSPARTVLGQRSLEAPTALVTDQHSLSDAEDFTEGYRTLKLGPVVGEPTAGWIIYTSNVNLIDGSSLRIPSTVIRGSDGKVMEMNPRPVDVFVERPVGESYTGKDSQLDAAVRELLKVVGVKTAGKGQ